jgi:hypothetical protein
VSQSSPITPLASALAGVQARGWVGVAGRARKHYRRGSPGVQIPGLSPFPCADGYSRSAGRRSTALTHRWRPSAPRTRPNHSRRSLTHQSSWPPGDHVAAST